MRLPRLLGLGLFRTSQLQRIHSSIGFGRRSLVSKMSEFASTSGYVDVHAHLIHEQFHGEEDAVAEKCRAHGLEYVVCNGLEPVSNRATMDLSLKHSNILPALGIYPLDAACNLIEEGKNWNHPFPPPVKFDIEAEVAFIDSMAAEKRIIAIGECGLDKHYLTDAVTFAEQERVLRLLMRVAKKHSLPIILHTRKAEARVLEMLIEEEVEKADFHCFCGKAKLGQQIAEAGVLLPQHDVRMLCLYLTSGYYLSIPSCVENNSQFRKLVEVDYFVRMHFIFSDLVRCL